MNSLSRMMLRAVDRLLPARRVIWIQDDELPARLPRRDILLANDDGEPYVIGMRCPCGCGRRLEMIVSSDITPCWKVSVDAQARPTLDPSVHVRDGCFSHFWLRKGRVRWC